MSRYRARSPSTVCRCESARTRPAAACSAARSTSLVSSGARCRRPRSSPSTGKARTANEVAGHRPVTSPRGRCRSCPLGRRWASSTPCRTRWAFRSPPRCSLRRFAGQRALWGLAVVRLLMVAPAACFLFAAQIESRVMPVLWGSALGIEWVIGVPGGLTLPLRQAMFATLPAVATLVAGVFALALSWRQPRPRWMIAPACIGLIAGGILLGRARAQHRYPVFAALCEQPPAFVMHAIKRAYAGAWPIWRELDD